MKRVGSVFFCAIFFILILLPPVLMPWSRNLQTENRLPAPAPEVFKNGGLNLSLPGDIEEYFKDRFAGRTQMINAYSRIVGWLFNVSANDKVVMGRDGWLFFQETVGDYTGNSALSDTEMDALINALLEIKRAAEARGQVFLIAIAPNKNSIYGEYMPRRYKKTVDPTNYERLMAAGGLDFIDLHSSLLEMDRPMYYLTDTHWNGLGAHLAAREIMLAIEEKTGVMADFDWDATMPKTGPVTGDLGRMLYPENPPEETDYFFDDVDQSFSTVGRYRSPDDLHITTESDGATLHLAIYRDSFANSLIPYFSNAYSNVYYTRQTPPPMDSAAMQEADVIIFELAERRIGELYYSLLP